MTTAVTPPPTAGRPPDEPTAPGWAATTLREALRTTVLVVMAVWVLVMTAVVLVSEEAAAHRAALAVGHLALFGLTAAVWSRRAPLWVIPSAIPVMLTVDWALARSLDGVLCFATAWACNMAHLVPALLMRGRARDVFGWVMGLGVPAALAVVHPDWVFALVLPAVVTGLGIRRAARLGLTPLEAAAELVDREFASLWHRRRALRAARAVSREAAEQSRIVHDTAINTLAALAEGAASGDERLVREVCARDRDTLAALLDGARPAPPFVLGAAAIELGLAPTRHGLDDDELTAALGRLPDDRRRALSGALREALRNVAKHAPGAPLTITVTADDDVLSVEVADDGPGFDGRAVPGRGLAESILARAHTAGIDVEVTSAPGRGATVRMRCPFRAGPDDDADDAPAEDAAGTIEALLRRASWLWTAAVVAVGVFIEFVNRFGNLSPAYGMLATVAAVGAVTRHTVEAGRSPGRLLALALVVATPVAFILGLAAVDYGRHEVILWQAFGVTPPLVLIALHVRSRVVLASAVAALLASAAASTAKVSEPEHAAVVLVGTFAPLAVLLGWTIFQRSMERIGRAAAEAQRAGAATRADLAAQEAVARAHHRWEQAGLRRATALLDEVADGRADPRDPAVRERCAEEEAYLRQVTLLSPELVNAGDHLARALARARERRVVLEVRTGSIDVGDEVEAARLGAAVETAVEVAPPAARLTTTLFPSRGALCFGLVAPSPVIAHVARRWEPPEGWDTSVHDHDEVGILEATSGPVGPS